MWVPQTYPRPNPWNLWMYEFTWGQGIKSANQLTTRGEIILIYLNKFHVIMRVLLSEEGRQKVRIRERLKDD